MRKLLYLIPVVVLLFTACEVEFSPNASWKNVPVVYCLLDQDDDTTWVRVQRCYLAEDNIYNYGQNSDSINYPHGAITVSLLAYENGTQKDSMAFEYTTRDRDTGNFASTAQPLYFFRTKNRLKENYTYVLTIRNAADNAILATTDPISLIKQTNANLITKPTVTVYNGDTLSGGLDFYDPMGNNMLGCQIKWNHLENARLYQPFVRFYYKRSDSVLYHADFMCPKVSSKYSEVYYSRDLFLDQIRNYFAGDTTRKLFVPRVDMYLTCCSEDLNAYLNTVSNTGDIAQSTEVYNNIKGGVGVFAARRTHLFKRMPANADMTPNRGLLYFLVQLNLGFY
ncbi:MAG: DUF4249 family protein [Bacteroidales bacterium]|nr:DUF4249 family protein [Bacteroidales bacterium]